MSMFSGADLSSALFPWALGLLVAGVFFALGIGIGWLIFGVLS